MRDGFDAASDVLVLMRVLCSAGVGQYASLLRWTLPSYVEFCHRHSYGLYIEQSDLADGRPPAWGKIPLIRKLLHEFDEVLWIDADAAIVRLDVDIAAEVPAGVTVALVAHHYFGMELPNTGVMLWRRDRHSSRLLSLIWNQHHLTHHLYWEQAAFLEVLGYDVDVPRAVRLVKRTVWLRHVHYLSNVWNSTRRDSHPNPRVVHCAGETYDRRVALLQRLACEGQLPQWVGAND